MKHKQRNLLILCVLMLVFWFSGLAAICCVKIIGGLVLPVSISDEVDLTGLSYSNIPVELLPGADLRVNPARMNYILKEVSGWKYKLIPPGLIRNGFTVSALNTIDMPDGSFAYFPLRITLDDTLESPLFRVRVKKDFLSSILQDSDMLGKRNRRKKWVLGHYELTNMKKFDTFTLSSVPVKTGEKIILRQFKADATGWVRYKLDENLLSAQSTAKVKELALEVDLAIRHEYGGFCMNYEVRVTALRADFNNIAPVLDHQLCAQMRDSFESSFNKDKKKKSLSRILFPQWTPIDMNFDIKLVP